MALSVGVEIFALAHSEGNLYIAVTKRQFGYSRFEPSATL